MSLSEQPLKLMALDEEDLSIISAHCQDAILRLDEIAYLKSTRRFALIMNRFDWESAHEREEKQYRRRRAALRFECVEQATRLNLPAIESKKPISLLAIHFEPAALPAGSIHLLFAGGGEIKLQVECIEAELRDLGAIWETGSRPDHQLPDDGSTD